MEKIRILIVEDDPIIGADLQDRLLDMGYDTLGPIAAGEQALQTLAEPPAPDLVLMDIQLEGAWDGIETTRRIREQHAALPVIFLTSNSDEATFAHAKSVRPQAFLSKPFRGRDLRHAIELAIGQSAKEHAAATGTPATDIEEDAHLLADRLFIKVNERMVRLFLRDILWMEADDYYCKIVTHEREFLVGQTLKKLGESLTAIPELMRVHRSYIVNLAHIEEIGEAQLHIGRKEIPLSKTAREELLLRIQKI
ncbi:MAG: LytR/AlgR family response regulator transcription factor [Saprospiraceae bacterium]